MNNDDEIHDYSTDWKTYIKKTMKVSEYSIKNIKKGDTVVLKVKFRKHYKEKYNAKTVDTSLPVKIAKYLPNKGKIYLEGWEEVHNIKGGAVPLSSFDIYSDRKAKIFDFYKPDAIITKTVAQIQEWDDKNLIAVCIKNSKVIGDQFPLDLFYEIIRVEKGVYFTITSTIIPGKHIIDYSPSTEEEIVEYNKFMADF